MGVGGWELGGLPASTAGVPSTSLPEVGVRSPHVVNRHCDFTRSIDIVTLNWSCCADLYRATVAGVAGSVFAARGRRDTRRCAMRLAGRIGGAALTLALTATAVNAQTTAPSAPPDPPSIEELIHSIEVLQQQVEQQGREIADLRRQLGLSSGTATTGAAMSAAPAANATGLADHGTAAPDQSVKAEHVAQRGQELPPDVVSAGDFPGSVRIPGTDAVLKFGGLIRVN
jgi:hypothetical protein